MRLGVVILTDSPMLAEGLESMLSRGSNYEVVAVEDSLKAAQESILRYRASILVVEPHLITREYRRNLRDHLAVPASESHFVLVALVARYTEQRILKQFDGLLELSNSRQDVRAILDNAVQHENPEEETSQPAGGDLSDRERAVLICVARGKQNKEIADELSISPHTVISHRKNIVAKTGIKSVAGLTVYALMNGLIEESEIL